MANARPTGKLTTGAVGNFLLGAAAVLFTLTVGTAMFAGGQANEGAGLMGLISVVLIIGGGICGGLGWFGLGKLYGGVNSLAGVFSILLGLVPILMVVLAMSAVSSARSGDMTESSAGSMGMIGLVLGLGVPALLGIFGGLGVMGAKTGLAKPAGIVLLIGGLGLAGLFAMIMLKIMNPSLMQIASYVGFFGLAIGFFLSGATMLSERAGEA